MYLVFLNTSVYPLEYSWILLYILWYILGYSCISFGVFLDIPVYPLDTPVYPLDTPVYPLDILWIMFLDMVRFSQLLQKETILICLEKEDPPLTLSIFSLLSFLVRSEDVVGMLCARANPADPCLLLTCYQTLLDPPASASKETAYRIQVEVRESLGFFLV